MDAPRDVIKLAVDATDVSLPFVKIVTPGEDGAPYDPNSPHDAELDLSQGTPRFYIMNLPHRGHAFDRITYHAAVTQCLASTGDGRGSWYIAVAAPTFPAARGPDLARDVTVLKIPPGVILKMDKGTWHVRPCQWCRPRSILSFLSIIDPRSSLPAHADPPTHRRQYSQAGPFFESEHASFFNLELHDTNVVDHNTHDYGTEGVRCVIQDLVKTS